MTAHSRRVAAALGGIAISVVVGCLLGLDHDRPLESRMLFGAGTSLVAVAAWIAVVWTLVRVRPRD